jgi:hypothetical protein
VAVAGAWRAIFGPSCCAELCGSVLPGKSRNAGATITGKEKKMGCFPWLVLCTTDREQHAIATKIVSIVGLGCGDHAPRAVAQHTSQLWGAR